MSFFRPKISLEEYAKSLVEIGLPGLSGKSLDAYLTILDDGTTINDLLGTQFQLEMIVLDLFAVNSAIQSGAASSTHKLALLDSFHRQAYQAIEAVSFDFQVIDNLVQERYNEYYQYMPILDQSASMTFGNAVAKHLSATLDDTNPLSFAFLIPILFLDHATNITNFVSEVDRGYKVVLT